jgi:hypothetical protein
VILYKDRSEAASFSAGFSCYYLQCTIDNRLSQTGCIAPGRPRHLDRRTSIYSLLRQNRTPDTGRANAREREPKGVRGYYRVE